MFFRYAIKAGWIGPELRVIGGTLVGLACVAGSEALRKRTPAAANALAAGGIVVLYGAFWAAHVLYKLVPMELAFVLMALVTAIAALLADRRRSAFIALLGLSGGFVTPLVLASGSNRPIELFTYALGLDAAFLYVAWRRKWAFLSAVALLGTFILQSTWIFARMESPQLWLGLVIVGVFALFFAASGSRLATDKDRWQWVIAQAGAILLPFGFALWFVAYSPLDTKLWQLGLLLALLAIAAGWLGRQWKNSLLALGVAAGTLAVLLAWIAFREVGNGWEVVGIALGLAAIPWAFALSEAEKKIEGAFAPAALTAGGALFLLAFGAGHQRLYLPYLLAWIALAAMLFTLRRRASYVAATGLACALVIFFWRHHPAGTFSLAWVHFSVCVGVATLFSAAAWKGDEHDHHAAALLASLLMLGHFGAPIATELGASYPLAVLALAFVTILGATMTRAGGWMVAGLLLAAGSFLLRDADEMPLATLVIEAAGVLLFALWPFLVPKRFATRAAWEASALAGPLLFFALRDAWNEAFGDAAMGLLAVVLGGIALGTAFLIARTLPADDKRRRGQIALHAGVALSFAALAVPLQLEKEWVTIAWALQGAAVIWLWRRLDHAGLKWFGAMLLAFATTRLVANLAILEYHARPEWRIVNWLLWTYGASAAALLVAQKLLAEKEVERLRPWERSLMPWGTPLLAASCGLAAIVVAFVWINLAIADWYSPGDRLLISFQRLPARDLTTSLAWAGYAVLLLALGMARKSGVLRWTSLMVLVLAVGKVFLYDLGELRDLWRVASLFGLAMTLILVSFAYQRFVFRKEVPA